MLRIRSQNLVDEPVVTVTVRGKLPVKTQRRYVLADVASNVVGAPESACLIGGLRSVALARPVLARLLHLHPVVPMPLRHPCVQQRRRRSTNGETPNLACQREQLTAAQKVLCWYHPTPWRSRPANGIARGTKHLRGATPHHGNGTSAVRQARLKLDVLVCPWTTTPSCGHRPSYLASRRTQSSARKTSCGGNSSMPARKRCCERAEQVQQLSKEQRPCVT